MNAYVAAMTRYATFRGRAGRREYWMFLVIFIVLSIACSFIDAALGTTSASGVGAISSLCSLAHLIPSIAVFVRRLHDGDRSGWWYFLLLVPVANILLIVWLAQLGTPGPNRFGVATDPI